MISQAPSSYEMLSNRFTLRAVDAEGVASSVCPPVTTPDEEPWPGQASSPFLTLLILHGPRFLHL